MKRGRTRHAPIWRFGRSRVCMFPLAVRTLTPPRPRSRTRMAVPPVRKGTGTRPYIAVNLNHASNYPYLYQTDLHAFELFLAVQ